MITDVFILLIELKFDFLILCQRFHIIDYQPLNYQSS